MLSMLSGWRLNVRQYIHVTWVVAERVSVYPCYVGGYDSNQFENGILYNMTLTWCNTNLHIF